MIAPETPPDLPPDDPTEESSSRLTAFQSWMEHHFKINARLQGIESKAADISRELVSLRSELASYRVAQEREAAAAEATQAAQERAAEEAAKQRQEAAEARALKAEEERAQALTQQARTEERFARLKTWGGLAAGVLGFGAAIAQGILSILRGGQ